MTTKTAGVTSPYGIETHFQWLRWRCLVFLESVGVARGFVMALLKLYCSIVRHVNKTKNNVGNYPGMQLLL